MFSNADLFCNGVFTFHVGGKEFIAHKDAVGKKSAMMKAKMNNGMTKESLDGEGPLKEVTADTFGRFLEFAYTGDYNAAWPKKVAFEVSLPTPATMSPRFEFEPCNGQPLQTGLSTPRRSKRLRLTPALSPRTSSTPTRSKPLTWTALMESSKSNNKTSKTRPVEAEVHLALPESKKVQQIFPSLKFNIDVLKLLPTQSEVDLTQERASDCLPVFMSHAELYVFAQEHLVFDLRHLAAARLHAALSSFYYVENSPTDITKLVAFVYERTGEDEEEVDLLRAVVISWCANNTTKLANSESFLALMEEGGCFVRDLFRRMGGRLEYDPDAKSQRTS